MREERKYHLLVDTHGFALKVVVSAANVQDRNGERRVAQALHFYESEFPGLCKMWADVGLSGLLVEELSEQMVWDIESVTHLDAQPKGAFTVQPHRWVVE